MKKHLILIKLVFIFTILGSSFRANSQQVSETRLAEANKIIAGFEKQGFSGAGLIAQNGQVLRAFHSGYTGTNKKDLITDSTRFNIASVTKAFTAVAIMQLAENGKLKLADPVSKYLGPLRGNASEITIHQLLSHQSGIGQNYASDGVTNADAAVKKIFASPLEAKPGQKFIYSNDNYALLAIVVEKVAGATWQQYVRANILNPLQMRNTMFWDDYFFSDKPKTQPYTKVRSDLKVRNYGFSGATGIFSTASDLLKFTGIFTDTTFLSAASLKLMKQEYVVLAKEEPWDKNAYGYGLFIKKQGEKETICFRGNEGGWGTAMICCYPQDKVAVVVLSNAEELKSGEKPHIALSRDIIKSLYRNTL